MPRLGPVSPLELVLLGETKKAGFLGHKSSVTQWWVAEHGGLEGAEYVGWEQIFDVS